MTANTPPTLKAIRGTPPATPDHLWDWVWNFTGVRIARTAVCRGHQAPFTAFASWWFDQPAVALMLGPRGGGKSFLSSINTHLRSRYYPRHGTRVLGGSRAQSEQIYRALKDVILDGRGPLGTDSDAVRALLRTEALYRNGSEVSILAASPTSVRGPHVPSLKLDEVDEIPSDIRESSLGMCMGKHGVPASVLMTSTWHRLGGPMDGLIAQARAGEFPFHAFCLFEVLERCPEERSGPDLERCPECPLQKWCHSEGLPPKAKRSDGHYPIDSAIQKVKATSLRVFEADYLCLGPRADGIWFQAFEPGRHCGEAAAYDPCLPVHLAIDSGVFTGAVAFQVRPPAVPGELPLVTVFMDYLSEGVAAAAAAGEVLARLDGRNGTTRTDWTDPAGGARNAVGPTVIGEYQRSGLAKVRPWPLGSVADGLAQMEALIDPAAGGPPRLMVHPSCTRLIDALRGYRRAKRKGQWQDYPEDPQHPHEDVMDALRGGLKGALPDGFKAPAVFKRQSIIRRFY